MSKLDRKDLLQVGEHLNPSKLADADRPTDRPTEQHEQLVTYKGNSIVFGRNLVSNRASASNNRHLD